MQWNWHAAPEKPGWQSQWPYVCIYIYIYVCIYIYIYICICVYDIHRMYDIIAKRSGNRDVQSQNRWGTSTSIRSEKSWLAVAVALFILRLLHMYQSHRDNFPINLHRNTIYHWQSQWPHSYYDYGQFSKFHVCFCGLDPGNLKFETAWTNRQRTCC